MAAIEELMGDDAEREEIAGRRKRLAPDLLGRHVGWRADDGRFQRDHGPFSRQCQPEIGQLDLSPGVDEDVFRLDIAVDDLLGVRRLQRRRHLGEDGALLREGKIASIQPLPQRLRRKILK